MGISFSAMRKILEQENICNALKGRIRYFVTRYRESHDELGRVAILDDDIEVIKSNWFAWSQKTHVIPVKFRCAASPNELALHILFFGLGRLFYDDGHNH